jgi:hypothetical protein
MPWREVTRKVFDCDGCGKTLKDPEFEQVVTFPMDAELKDYDIREDVGWAEIDGKTYCPDDWHWCEGGGWTPVLGKIEDCPDTECIEARG